MVCVVPAGPTVDAGAWLVVLTETVLCPGGGAVVEERLTLVNGGSAIEI